MSTVYGDTLRVNVVVDAAKMSKSIEESVNKIGREIMSSPALEQAMKKQMAAPLADFKQQLKDVNAELAKLTSKTAGAISQSQMDSYISDLQDVQKQYTELADKVKVFSDASLQAFGSGFDKSSVAGFMATVKDLVTFLSPLKSSFSDISQLFRQTFDPSTTTTISAVDTAIEKLGKRVEYLDTQLQALKINDESIADKLTQAFGVGDINDVKVDDFLKGLRQVKAEFDDALKLWNTGADRSENMQRHLTALANTFIQLNKAADDSSSKKIANYLASDAVGKSFDNAVRVVNNYETTLKNQKKNAETQIEELRKSVIEADKMLLDFKDGSIKIPVELNASTKDIVSAAQRMVYDVNTELKRVPVLLSVEPKIDLDKAKDNIKEASDSLLGNISKKGNVTGPVLQRAANQVMKDMANQAYIQNIQGVGEAQTILGIKDAVKELVGSVNSVREGHIVKLSEALPGIVTSMTDLVPLLAQAKENIGTGLIDFENIAKATENIKKLIEQFQKLNEVTDPAKNASGQALAKKNMWDIANKLSPDMKSYIKDTDRRDFLKKRFTEEYQTYLNYGGIDKITEILGDQTVNGVTFKGFAMPIKKSLQGFFDKIPKVDNQTEFIQSMVENINKLQEVLAQINVKDTGLPELVTGIQSFGNAENLQSVSTNITTITTALQELLTQLKAVVEEGHVFHDSFGKDLTTDVSGIKNVSEILDAASKMATEEKKAKARNNSFKDPNEVSNRIEKAYRAFRNTELQIQNVTQKKFEQMQKGDTGDSLKTYENTLQELNEVYMRRAKAYGIAVSKYVASMQENENFDVSNFNANIKAMREVVDAETKNKSLLSKATHEDRMHDINANIITKDNKAQQKADAEQEKAAAKKAAEAEKALEAERKAREKEQVASRKAEDQRYAAEAKANAELLEEKRRTAEEEAKLYQQETDALQKHLADMDKQRDQEIQQEIKDADKSKAAREAQLKGSQDIWDKQLQDAKTAAKAVADAQKDLKAVQTNLILGAINKDNISGSGVDFGSYSSVTERQSQLNTQIDALLDIEEKLKTAPEEVQAKYRAYLSELVDSLTLADADFAQKIRDKRSKILEGVRSDYVDKLLDFEKTFQDKLKGVSDGSGAPINVNELINLNDDEIRSRFNNLSETGIQSLIRLRDTAKQAFNDIETELATVDLKNLTPEKAQARTERYARVMRDLNDAISENAKVVHAQTFAENAVRGVEYENIKTIDDFHIAVDKYTHSIKDATDISGKFSSNGTQWTGTFKDANGVVQQLTLSFNQLNGSMERTQFAKNGSDLGWLTDGIGGLKSGIKDVAKMGAMFLTFGNAAHGAMMMVRSSMQAGRQAVLDYDKALTNIKYTMNMTQQQFDDLGQSTVQMARDLKTSISDAMTISQIYANMQTTSEEILKTGRPTAILSNLSGAGTEAAANYIQSVQQQFDMTEEMAGHIVDVYDKVSASIKMDYAKGISNIASGVQAAGQVAHDAGLSFEELAAIIGKVTERTREDGSAIGNALKTNNCLYVQKCA